MIETQSLGTVALPETRQLDVLAQLLESRNVSVMRCPLVAILDTPHQAAVESWLRRFIAAPPELFVVYTGEGINRLAAAAEKSGMHGAFVAALSATEILTRGPKPVRALKSLGVTPQHAAAQPTTDGIISTLEAMDIEGKRIAVQYYGGEANETLAAYLERLEANVDAVMPYVYASEVEDRAVENLIRSLSDGDVDAIAFTSKAQVERLFSVAQVTGLLDELASALQDRIVAAVGPVVAAELKLHDCAVDVMPSGTYFMKPLVTQLVERLSNS